MLIDLYLRWTGKNDLPAEGCPVVLEHTSYVPSGTTPVYRPHTGNSQSII